MMLTKVILVVDAGVNVHDMREVAWRALANIDPRRDVFFLKGPADALEHASERAHVGTKMGIDGTAKSPAEGGREPWPHAIEMSPEVKELVERRWEEYGLG